MKPQTVGARELKIRLGTYLRRVRQGARIVVTERGEPVAELRPLSRTDSSEEARLEELASTGIVTRRSGKRLSPFRPLRSAGPPVAEALSADREDRF